MPVRRAPKFAQQTLGARRAHARRARAIQAEGRWRRTPKQKGRWFPIGPSACVARPERFELPTTKFVAWCSIQLSYGRRSGIMQIVSSLRQSCVAYDFSKRDLQLAETEGFEPSMELLTPYSLSRGAPSASRASLRRHFFEVRGEGYRFTPRPANRPCPGRPVLRRAGCAGKSLRDARRRPSAR